MMSRKAEETTGIVLDALRQAGHRGVIATGWGALSRSVVPDDVFMIGAAPHDWLFPKMAAVVHHGGAGTTGTGIRAGVPTVVVSFGGDQPFWGHRVSALGVGPAPIPRTRLTARRLADAMRIAVTDEAMRVRAAELGRRVRAEDGVANAIRIVNQHLHRLGR
jgi:UDP:flavonoid glycosyltransferase YjiC (YdhE family)